MTRFLLPAAALAALLGAQAQAATQVHALTISGQAQGGAPPFGCATVGPSPFIRDFFGGGVGVPTEGHAGCGLAGGIQQAGKASGLSLASSSVVGNAYNGGVNNASAQAKAEEGSLGVSASESFTNGTKDAATYFAAEAGAIWSDLLTPGMPGAGMGEIQFGFTIDGAMAFTGSGGELFTRLMYQVADERAIYTAFTAELNASGGNRAINPSGVGPLAGFTITPNSISGSDTAFTYRHTVDLSKPLSMKVGLYTAAYGAPNGVHVSNFFNTARLTQISVFDASGRPIDMTFTGASGTVYDATGAHRPIGGVPEPSQWALMILGFGLAGAAVRQRRRHPAGHVRAHGPAFDGQLAT
ncbi:MAG: PEPxxWA-CTERM sorting domain-containing protein [Phenylobacterium sp.]|nr:PEPxxWA-CTERM sorting domain-containing protein [Phenylobacterium sp.]